MPLCDALDDCDNHDESDASNGADVVAGHVVMPGRQRRTIDEAGRAFLGLVRPGAHWLTVYHADRSWVWCVPRLIEVLPGRCTNVELELAIQERKIQFVDAESGESLSDTRVAWTLGCPWNRLHSSATTDATGRLVLTIPDGEMRFHVVDRTATLAESIVEWGEGLGEVVVELATRR